MPLDVEVLEHVNAIGDGIGVEDLEKEVNSVISALKLPDISDLDIWTLILTMTQTLSQIQTEQLRMI